MTTEQRLLLPQTPATQGSLGGCMRGPGPASLLLSTLGAPRPGCPGTWVTKVTSDTQATFPRPPATTQGPLGHQLAGSAFLGSGRAQRPRTQTSGHTCSGGALVRSVYFSVSRGGLGAGQPACRHGSRHDGVSEEPALRGGWTGVLVLQSLASVSRGSRGPRVAACPPAGVGAINAQLQLVEGDQIHRAADLVPFYQR